MKIPYLKLDQAEKNDASAEAFFNAGNMHVEEATADRITRKGSKEQQERTRALMQGEEIQDQTQRLTSSVSSGSKDNTLIEINLLDLFKEFRRHIVMILLTALIFGAVTGVYFHFFVAPQYESTSVLYVLSKETTLTSLADLQIGTQLTNDYKEIITSRPVLEQVIENLGLDMSFAALEKMITIKNPSSTRILDVTARYTDPQMTKNIADEVATVSSEYIADIMEMIPPKSIEKGAVPTSKCYPSTGKNILIATLLGGLVSCLLITFMFLQDDTVKSAEDVKKYLDLPVLTTIAYSESVDYGKNKMKTSASGIFTGLKKTCSSERKETAHGIR